MINKLVSTGFEWDSIPYWEIFFVLKFDAALKTRLHITGSMFLLKVQKKKCKKNGSTHVLCCSFVYIKTGFDDQSKLILACKLARRCKAMIDVKDFTGISDSIHQRTGPKTSLTLVSKVASGLAGPQLAKIEYWKESNSRSRKIWNYERRRQNNVRWMFFVEFQNVFVDIPVETLSTSGFYVYFIWQNWETSYQARSL